MGQSAIDFLIVSPCCIPYIHTFEVEDFDRCISDTHCGLSLTLNFKTEKQKLNITKEDKEGTLLLFDLKWDHEKRGEFKNWFNEENTKEFVDVINNIDKDNVSNQEIDLVSDKLKEMFIKNSQDIGIYKNIREERINAKNGITITNLGLIKNVGIGGKNICDLKITNITNFVRVNMMKLKKKEHNTNN